MEDVAICIWLEGVLGTEYCFGVLFDPGEPRPDCGLSAAVRASEASLCNVSGRATGRGGGNGEMETADMLAEWAW